MVKYIIKDNLGSSLSDTFMKEMIKKKIVFIIDYSQEMEELYEQ